MAKFPDGHDPDKLSMPVRQEIRDHLTGALRKNIRYDDPEKFVLGFMGTTPDDMAVEGYQTFLRAHPNNIGEHTLHNDELGFPGTNQLEAEVISMLGDLHGDSTVNGYLSFDGSEANIQAVWVGREYLMQHCGIPNDTRVCLMTSHLSHYSLSRAYRLLRLGGGIVSLPTDEKGSILVDRLEEKIRSAYHDFGLRRFIIVAMGGSTLLGSVDDVQAIGNLIEKLEMEYNTDDKPENKIGIFLHVDAAFGGFVTPFLNPPILTGFNAHSKVKSMTIDPHKMGLSVYPGGAFLCRNGLIKMVSAEVGYVGGHHDVTLAGSRPGAEAAACWAVMQALGRKGYTKKVRRCIEITNYLFEKLKTVPGIKLIEPTMNIVAFRVESPKVNEALQALDDLEHNGLQYDQPLPENFPQHLRKTVELYRCLQLKYIVVGAGIPTDMSNLRSPTQRLIRFVLMPHPWLLSEGEKVIDDFVGKFRNLFN